MKITSLRGFTLIELLVVMSIISLLVALLLPALASARNATTTLTCANNQRGMFVAFNVYAHDYRQYPTNYQMNTTDAGNHTEECSGYMSRNTTATYTYAGNSYSSNSTDETGRLPAWYKTSMFAPASPLAHVTARGYITTPKMFACATTAGTTYQGSFPAFHYNGPNTHGRAIANNGGGSFLSRLGRHTQPFPYENNPSWGVRFGIDPVVIAKRSFGAATVAFMVCPAVTSGSGAALEHIEPHGPPNRYLLGSSAQYDSIWWSAGIQAVAGYQRNVLYADGHVVFRSYADRTVIP
jgi:prepilin-type N-terminal cleavage/methylation domain-containing protein/prepilin-type processing-associated H-X9-DG protein